MGLGHPALLAEGWTRLGLFPCSLCLPHPAQAWPACLPLLSLPLARLARARDPPVEPGACRPSGLGAPIKLWVNVEVPGHHAQSQAAPTPSSPPGPQGEGFTSSYFPGCWLAGGVLGRWYHVWLPPPHQLGLGLCPQLFPDDQRDRQHLDSLPAHLVLPVAPPGAGGRPGLPVGALPLAAARLPAARLPLPVCIVLRAHLQLHVAPRASHLLLPGLRCAQPLQPGFPELESPGLSKILRSAAFIYPFLFDNLPLFYRLGLCWGRGRSCGQEALSTSHGYHLFCALLTGFLFASHLPERLAPGRFDYIGHSHQLFHICAVLGTHFQLEAVLTDMGSRRAWLATQEPPLGLAGTVATLGLAVAGNLLIIAAFTASLFRAPSTCPLLQGGSLERGTKAKLQ
ncbi:PREDICTED: progestin and adipoQ receptor family member 6 isoform X1 [Bison bison bison]|uniref:Progestin and adipoQ receptor family member 6 isoform X1 n=1 Tax=Bison bison bison TaxID=43346 RepID=A0A6P3HDA5_BISBB|nr:PREDICTED: progestin and adipoQ receptor family member 6 isoform X1 [Bison bison bison]